MPATGNEIYSWKIYITCLTAGSLLTVLDEPFPDDISDFPLCLFDNDFSELFLWCLLNSPRAPSFLSKIT